MFVTPLVFYQIDDSKRSFTEGFSDDKLVVDDLSWLEITSVNDLVGTHYFCWASASNLNLLSPKTMTSPG